MLSILKIWGVLCMAVIHRGLEQLDERVADLREKITADCAIYSAAKCVRVCVDAAKTCCNVASHETIISLTSYLFTVVLDSRTPYILSPSGIPCSPRG